MSQKGKQNELLKANMETGQCPAASGVLSPGHLILPGIFRTAMDTDLSSPQATATTTTISLVFDLVIDKTI